MLRYLVIISIGLLLAATAWSDELVTALRQQDSSTLSRLGASEGAAGLKPRLLASDRLVVISAIQAAPEADDAWALLGALAQAAQNPDRSIAAPAAFAGVRIAASLDLRTIDQEEISSHSLLSWQTSWLAAASDQRRWVDIRIYALEAAGRLNQLLLPAKRGELAWGDYTGDEDPEMRAAAITLSGTASQATTILERLEDDPEESVALAAGQWLCGPLGAPISPPSLSEAAITRLQTLAAAKHLPIVARADLGLCLAVDASPESQQALKSLERQSPPMLKQALQRLPQAP